MAILVFELRTQMINTPAINALVGTRIYPNVLPANPTMPAMTYRTISAPRGYAHSSRSLQGATVTERVQLSCWGASYSTAKQLAATVRTSFSGYRGSLGVLPVGSVALANELDLIDPNTQVPYTVLDLLIDYGE